MRAWAVIVILAAFAAFVIALAIGAYLVVHGHPWFGGGVMLLSVMPLVATRVHVE